MSDTANPTGHRRDTGTHEANTLGSVTGEERPATAQEIQERLDRIREAIYAAQHEDPSANLDRSAPAQPVNKATAPSEVSSANDPSESNASLRPLPSPPTPLDGLTSPGVVSSTTRKVAAGWRIPDDAPQSVGGENGEGSRETAFAQSIRTDAVPDVSPQHDVGASAARIEVADGIDSASEETDVAGDDAHAVATIDSILSAPQRHDGIEAFAQTLLPHFRDANVAIAVGRTSITRIVDGRLGWLSAGNVIRRRCQSVWELADRHDREALEASAKASFAERCRGVVGVDGYRMVSLGTLASGHRIRLAIMPTTGGRDAESAPVWVLKHRASIMKAIESRPLHRWISKESFVGSKPLVIVAVLFLVMIGFGLWPVAYPVRCEMALRPESSRRVAAPFEASLAEAFVQPGDVVAAGDTLVRLDGRPLRLELESIRSEMAAVAKDRLVAMAAGNLGEAQAAELQVEKLRHRGQMLSDRLQRLDVISPIDGVVIAEDLQPHVGTPLTTGQTLLEVASLDPLEAEIEVPAFEVNMIGSGASVRLRTDAGGGPSSWTRLDTIDPAAEIREDQQVFLTRVAIPNPDAALRPGMRGDAVIYGPMRPMAWSLLRPWYERVLWYAGY